MMTPPERSGSLAGFSLTGWVLAALALALAPGGAAAHSASDAYLSLVTARPAAHDKTVLHGQWDIALRDLDFVLKLDDDGNGKLTWREVRTHQAAIAKYAYRFLSFETEHGGLCTIMPLKQMVDDHADGAYAALFFDAVCPRAPRTVKLNYRLFFDIDPSHRGIFVIHDGDDVATALLSPDNPTIDVHVAP